MVDDYNVTSPDSNDVPVNPDEAESVEIGGIPTPPPPPPPPSGVSFTTSDGGAPHKPKRDDFYTPQSHNFSWIEVWQRALTQPDVNTYQVHLDDPQASLMRGTLWIFLVSLVTMVTQSILSTFFNVPLFETLGNTSGDTTFFAGDSIISLVLCAPILAAIGVVLFFIWNGIQYLVARLLGGEGSFDDQAYLMASYQAPLNVITTLVGFVPILGVLVSLGLFLYSMYLSVIALEVAHRLSRGRAVVAALWWLLVLPACAIVVICMLAVAGSSISDGFFDAATQSQ